MIDDDSLGHVEWRKSSFSGGGGQGGGNCVEIAHLADGRIAVRNSTHPEKGAVLFTRAEMDSWFTGVKAGEFDPSRFVTDRSQRWDDGAALVASY
ncbi:MAG: DUF397 domain-containing protein [Pseudonocardiaceae bacterium]